MNDQIKKTSRWHFGRWTGELFLVFIGVYAAFWLNNYQQHREEVKRRDLILATLEEQLAEGIASGRVSRAREEREAIEFHRALKAGEMPQLRPFVFTTDYNPGDIGALLQSGGVALLDVKTLVALRELESVIRWGLSDMARFQKLSDEMIVPNLGRDISFFYDPATKQLREPYEIYPQALDATVKFARDVERAKIKLVEQMKAVRGKRP